ncbi:MAG TPA: DUF1206 domain-containing protein [Ruminiclostridium sp.]
MSGKTNTIGKIKSSGKKLAHNATFNPIVEIMARLGYGARGAIYFVMGILTLLLALGKVGNTTDQQGAIVTIGTQPEGRILLWIIFVGLVCYSLWGLIRAVFNPLHKEHNTKGNAERVGYLFSGIAYALLVLPTYALITGGVQPALNGEQGVQTKHYVAKILTIPLGQLLVGMVGVIVMLVGIFQIYQAFSSKFEEQIHLTKLTPLQEKRVKDFGRVGTTARGIIFALLGIFLIWAAYTTNSNQAKGFDGTLMSLLHLPYGHFLMGGMALGLIALGIYSLLVGIFFRLRK